MHSLWDYNKNDLEKTEEGRIMLLERQINYGPDRGEKIKLDEVKTNWDKLHLFTLQKRLLELLLWGHYLPLQKNNKSSIAK